MSAIPEYPTNDALPTLTWREEAEPRGMRQALDYWRMTADAALARLRVAEHYLQHDSEHGCSYRVQDCTCGLDELLATLLPSGEGR